VSKARERQIQELKEFKSPKAVIDVQYRVRILNELKYIELAYFHDIMDEALMTAMHYLPEGYSFVKALETYDASCTTTLYETHEEYCDSLVRLTGENLDTVYFCEALHHVLIASENLLNNDEINFCASVCEANGAISTSLGISSKPALDMTFFKQSGKIGGGATLPDKEPFQADYRAERLNFTSRGDCIASLRELYPIPKESTLTTWAKDADKEDKFIRNAGRPRKTDS